MGLLLSLKFSFLLFSSLNSQMKNPTTKQYSKIFGWEIISEGFLTHIICYLADDISNEIEFLSNLTFVPL